MPAIPFNPQKSARATATPATVPMAQAVPVQDEDDYEDLLRDVDAYDRKLTHTAAPPAATMSAAEAAYDAVDPAPAVTYLAEHLDAHQPVQPPPPVPSAEDPLAALQARLAALNNPGANGGNASS